MFNSKSEKLVLFFSRYSGYIIPRSSLGPFKVSRSMDYYTIGRHKKRHFYRLEKSLYGIRATFETSKNILSKGGHILYVDDCPGIMSINSEIGSFENLKWERLALSKSNPCDLLMLNNMNIENMVEGVRKGGLMVGIGSTTLANMIYPFNVNLKSVWMFYWFCVALRLIFFQVNQVKKSQGKKRNFFPSLLGKGPSYLSATGVKKSMKKDGHIVKKNEV